MAVRLCGTRIQRIHLAVFLCHFMIAVLVSIALAAIITAITAAIVHHYTTNSGQRSSQYAPVGIYRIPISNIFCQELSGTVQNNDDGYNVTLHGFESSPQLTGREQIFIPNMLKEFGVGYNLPGLEFSFPLYMYPGSSFSLDACIEVWENSYANVSFFLMTRDNFNFVNEDLWKNAVLNITTLCSSGRDTCTRQITSEGDYYLVFAPNPFDKFTTFSASMTFNLTHYMSQGNDSTAVSCSNTCVVNVPLHGTTEYYLSIWPPQNTSGWSLYNFQDNLDFDVTCRPRYWMYAVIGVGILMIIFPIVALVCIYPYYRIFRHIEEKERMRRFSESIHNHAIPVRIPVPKPKQPTPPLLPPPQPVYDDSSDEYEDEFLMVWRRRRRRQ